MFIFDSMLIGSIRFVLDKVLAAAEAETHDDTSLREQLLEAQMRLELGEIGKKEFARTETDLLARIREIRRHQVGGLTIATPNVKVKSVEVESYEEEEK